MNTWDTTYRQHQEKVLVYLSIHPDIWDLVWSETVDPLDDQTWGQCWTYICRRMREEGRRSLHG